MFRGMFHDDPVMDLCHIGCGLTLREQKPDGVEIWATTLASPSQIACIGQ